MTVLVRVFQRNRIKKRSVCVIVEAGKPQICRAVAGWKPREEVQFGLGAEFLLPLGRSVFVLLGPSTD